MLQKFSLSLLAGLLLASASVEARQDPLARAYEEAYIAWDEGRYITALEGFARLLDSPGGEAYLERIAEVTGEVYHTAEIAPDGRAVRFGPDGRYAAYETGTGAARVTHVLSLENGVRKIAEIEGAAGLVFSPDGERVAYLAHSETRAVRDARAELEKAASAGDRAELFRRRAALAYEEARAVRVAIRDLRTAREERFRTGDLLIAELTFSTDGETLYAVAGRDGDATRTDIYVIAERGEPVALTDGPGYKQALAVVPGGTHLVYTVDARSPVPQAPGTQLAQQASGDARRVVIHELATGAERAFEGYAPALSADGSTVVFLTAEDGVNVIQTARVPGDASPATALRTTDRIAAPALSPDGSTVVYQRMPREDWELFLVDAEGGNDRRLTWEIQHDHTARFIGPNTVLAVMGEGRHCRSYLYDSRTMERTRLHHNNTVRTIAPEYEWAVDPAGERVLIVSDRDGDTVSPERGVYLMDLTRRVTPAELRERIRTSLAAERDLRERGEKSFAPIEAEVRRIVERASKTKLYEYQDDLHRFGSKHITQPGNLKAAEYLFRTLESWGYEPEYQWFEPRPGIRTPNVVATLRGTVDPDLVYVVGSHFDSVERGPGADDNTSGTAVLLETARVLADSPLPATVQFVFFTGEESGLLGAREYVRRALEERTEGPRSAQQRHGRLRERPPARQHDPLLERRDPRHPARGRLPLQPSDHLRRALLPGDRRRRALRRRSATSRRHRLLPGPRQPALPPVARRARDHRPRAALRDGEGEHCLDHASRPRPLKGRGVRIVRRAEACRSPLDPAPESDVTGAYIVDLRPRRRPAPI